MTILRSIHAAQVRLIGYAVCKRLALSPAMASVVNATHHFLFIGQDERRCQYQVCTVVKGFDGQEDGEDRGALHDDTWQRG